MVTLRSAGGSTSSTTSHSAAIVTASPSPGAPASSLAELREASKTSYFKEGETLWAKLVVDNAAGLTLSPAAGGNAPPGLATRVVPVGAKLDVSRQVQVSSAPAGKGEPRRQ
jgi:cell migration-inducing and hyaluronan-binding protein